jgi:hypothetical protein
MKRPFAIVLASGMLVLGACGDEETAPASTGEPAAPAETEEPTQGTTAGEDDH